MGGFWQGKVGVFWHSSRIADTLFEGGEDGCNQDPPRDSTIRIA